MASNGFDGSPCIDESKSSNLASNLGREEFTSVQPTDSACGDQEMAQVENLPHENTSDTAVISETQEVTVKEDIRPQLKADLVTEVCVTGEHAIGKCDNQEMADLENSSLKHPTNVPDSSASKHANATEATQSNLGEGNVLGSNEGIDSCAVSEEKSFGSKEDVEGAKAESSGRKRERLHMSPSFVGNEEHYLDFHRRKRSRISMTDRSIFRISNVDGPISTGPFPSTHSTLAIATSSTGMFDDAEGDETFDFESFNKRPDPNTSNIRPDLLAAILGSPPKPIIPSRSTFVKPEKQRSNPEVQKKIANKKPKKISTEKERTAAIALIDGEIDLLRVLPREDCNFLGKKCYVFTLKQLEWLLDEDDNAPDASSRLDARNHTIQKLMENHVIFDQPKNTGRGSTDQIMQEESTSMSVDISAALPVSDQAPVATEKNTLKSESSKDFNPAEKIEVWKRLIDDWKKLTPRPFGDKDQFPLLDGPMSCFFPAGTLQFIESIKVRYAFDFLSLKKTESGLVVEMFRAWRKKCRLKDVNLLPLSKHLTGIGARIEESIAGNLLGGKEMSKWIIGPMVVVSGAAKEFLIDYSKVFSGHLFLEKKTKLLADEFSEWRLKCGLSELKGSGKVAMISAWKTQVKEELELESSNGMVIPEKAIKEEMESSSETIPFDEGIRNQTGEQIKKIKPEKRKSKTKYQSLEAHRALESPEFFARFFGDAKKIKMLKSVGITSAEGFLDASKGKNSDLLKALMQMKDDQNNGKKIQESSCISLLYDWASRMKKRIEGIDKGKGNDFRKTEVPNGESKDNEKRKSSPRQASRPKRKGSTNPFDALSAPSREFLETSMKIFTAKDFLDARTTDIANEFIKWRESKGKQPLKGLGAVASVSGWKTLVRTKVAALGDLSQDESDGTKITKIMVGEMGTKTVRTNANGKRTGGLRRTPQSLPTNTNRTFSVEAKSEILFSIVSNKTSDAFYFELDHRRHHSNGSGVFFRYLGNDTSSQAGLNIEVNVTNDNVCYPVKINRKELSGKLIGRKSFHSRTNGTIDISDIACRFFADKKTEDNDYEDLKITLEEVISHFVLQKKMFYPGADENYLRESRQSHNVFEVQSNGSKKILLSLASPIEKGQAVELRVLPMDTFDLSWLEEACGEARNWIKTRLCKLPRTLLLELLQFLRRELAALFSKGTESPTINVLDGSMLSLMTPGELLIARRRIHWVASKIRQQIRTNDAEQSSRHISTDLVWAKNLVFELGCDSKLDADQLESVRKEIRQEVHCDFDHSGYNRFASTKDLWCEVANTVFDSTVDIIVRFSTELGVISTEENLVNELCSLVSASIVNLKSIAAKSRDGNENNLVKLALRYKVGHCHHSSLFPSFEQIIEDVYVQPYTDAMNLCNEPVSAVTSTKEVKIVATKKLCGSSKNQLPCFQDLPKAQMREKIEIDVGWYSQIQILAVVKSAMQCTLSVNPEDLSQFLTTIETRIIEAAQLAMDGTVLKFPSSTEYEHGGPTVVSTLQPELKPTSVDISSSSSPTPSSVPFFFGFVWPQLRNRGWKLLVGSSPSEISFTPPTHRKSSNKNFDRKNSLGRQRSNLARQTSRTGLGYIPKLTKRIFVKCSEPNTKVVSRDETNQTLSARAVLEKFGSSILPGFDEKSGSTNGNERRKIEEIVLQLVSLFNGLIPLTFGTGDKTELAKGKEWVDILDCRFLFRFLVILPYILQESSLPLQDRRQTIVIVHELLRFLSEKYKEVFPPSFQLPNEEYSSESKFPSRLIAQIKDANEMHLDQLSGKTSPSPDSDDGSVEVILSTDRVDLTDFVAITMSQTILARGAEEDRGKGGQPCIVCRHCLGQDSGKYFYGSVESLAACVTVVEKHILKCTEVDEEVKKAIGEAKLYHPKQRKDLPTGAQAAFFARLFDRMQSLARSGCGFEVHSGVAINDDFSSKSVGTRNLGAKMESPRVFDNHVDVMEHIQSYEPWKSDTPLAEMISKYYNCLEYGGKICNTEKSPVVFSSEWLYSKLAS